MEDANGTPMYMVIVERLVGVGDAAMRYGASNILRVIPCDTVTAPAIYDREVIPLYQRNTTVTVFYFVREPANPFRDAVAAAEDQAAEESK